MQGEQAALLEQGGERGAGEEGGDVVIVAAERFDEHVPAAGDQEAGDALDVHEEGAGAGLPEVGAGHGSVAGGEGFGDGAEAQGHVRWAGGADGGGLRQGEREVGAHAQAAGAIPVCRATVAHGAAARPAVRSRRSNRARTLNRR